MPFGARRQRREACSRVGYGVGEAGGHLPAVAANPGVGGKDTAPAPGTRRRQGKAWRDDEIRASCGLTLRPRCFHFNRRSTFFRHRSLGAEDSANGSATPVLLHILESNVLEHGFAAGNVREPEAGWIVT